MKYLKLYEKFGDYGELIKLVTVVDFEQWHESHEVSNFNKKDCLVAFAILDNLDTRLFDQWSEGFPFGKNRRILFEFSDLSFDKPKFGEIKAFNGYQLRNLAEFSPYFFESDGFYSILITATGLSLTITKYEDEWYSVTVYSSRYGDLCYLCDSLDGLREIITLVEDLWLVIAEYGESV